MKSRLFRVLICLLVVCCLIVNISPIKAKATTVVGTLLTFDGLMAALYSLSIGICATAFTVDAWNKVGETFRKVVTDTGDSTITEAWVDLEAMYDAYIPGGGNDPDDELKWAEKLKTALSRGLLAAIAGWLCTLVNMGGYEVEGETATSGWAYYGTHYLPILPTVNNHPYVYLGLTSALDRYGIVFTDEPLYYDFSTNHLVPSSTVSYYCYYLYVSKLENWNVNSSYSSSFSGSVRKGQSADFDYINYVWSNYDIFSYSDGVSLVYSGCEPSSTQTEIIEPSIYVGDIPEQIQNGDKDEDNLVLPIIDPFRVIQSPETALDDVNQLQQQLANGTTTLDQYLEQVQLQEPTLDPDPTTPSTDPSTPEDDNQENSSFTLDLTEFFPFCIPFDIYEFLSLLAADPVAPVFNWKIEVPQLGQTFEINVDLSIWDEVAALFRKLELFGFIVGLAYVTRKSYLRG